MKRQILFASVAISLLFAASMAFAGGLELSFFLGMKDGSENSEGVIVKFIVEMDGQGTDVFEEHWDQQAWSDQFVVDLNEWSGRTITLNLTISGEGNFDTMLDPEWAAGNEWRTFDSEGTTNVLLQDGALTGERIIEQVLVPTEPGELFIPPISFSFFDPVTGEYERINSQQITINVLPDVNSSQPTNYDNNPGSANTGVFGPENTSPGNIPVDNGIRPIKFTNNLSGRDTLLTQQTGYWLLWILPLFVIA